MFSTRPSTSLRDILSFAFVLARDHGHAYDVDELHKEIDVKKNGSRHPEREDLELQRTAQSCFGGAFFHPVFRHCLSHIFRVAIVTPCRTCWMCDSDGKND